MASVRGLEDFGGGTGGIVPNILGTRTQWLLLSKLSVNGSPRATFNLGRMRISVTLRCPVQTWRILGTLFLCRGIADEYSYCTPLNRCEIQQKGTKLEYHLLRAPASTVGCGRAALCSLLCNLVS
jgi:hypothetical protein